VHQGERAAELAQLVGASNRFWLGWRFPPLLFCEAQRRGWVGRCRPLGQPFIFVVCCLLLLLSFDLTPVFVQLRRGRFPLSQREPERAAIEHA
jgi:hypothetical protein